VTAAIANANCEDVGFRINAAARLNGLPTASSCKVQAANIALDRKMRAELAVSDPPKPSTKIVEPDG
jgi:ribosomal protein L20